MWYRKEANSRDRKSNIEKGGGGSIAEIRKEICYKYSKMTKCLNTFVAHCSFSRKRDLQFKNPYQTVKSEKYETFCVSKVIRGSEWGTGGGVHMPVVG